jgi:hypothetical protein
MLAKEIIPEGRFTQPQLELLKMFSKQYPDKVWLDIKALISSYFLDKASSEMDQLFEQNNWGAEKIQEWADTHVRTPYKKER